ncbi:MULTISPECIES: hypothetical protein [Aeromonas]|jgi:hypothetical protein|uniref:hypothetical protein n=1 Tax=Aeromonas TaxID=642 RepID=UPI0015E7CE2E|nr:hypothetical protein [Aeromonas veronii]
MITQTAQPDARMPPNVPRETLAVERMDDRAEIKKMPNLMFGILMMSSLAQS